MRKATTKTRKAMKAKATKTKKRKQPAVRAKATRKATAPKRKARKPVAAPRPRKRRALKLDITGVEILNPIYLGLGHHPARVSQDVWVSAVAQYCEEMGTELVLRAVSQCLLDEFASTKTRAERDPDPDLLHEDDGEQPVVFEDADAEDDGTADAVDADADADGYRESSVADPGEVTLVLRGAS